MARIPADELARLKSDVSLLALVEQQGYTVTRMGKDHAIQCPFHDDDTPSLIISPQTNLFHCFGCEAAGSVVDWVMKTQGVSFRHAVEVLQQANPSLAAGSKAVKTGTRRPLETLPLEQPDPVLMGQVIDYYHQTLLDSDEALAYLDKRGLNDRALITRFKLGYANRTLAYRLPQKQYKAGKQLRGQLQTLGILRESGHEHFNGSLVVPVLDGDGGVTEVYGRKILGNRLRKGTPQHLYLPGPHAGVWNADGLIGCEEVILCEALLDAMTFWVNGYTNVTASYGTGGFTEDHLALFEQLGTQRVLIAYDNDEAGNTAAQKLAKQLMAAGFACYRLVFPKGMDANQYALDVTPADQSLGVVIRSAQWLGDGDAPAREVHPLAAPEPALPAQVIPPAPVPGVEPAVADHAIHLTYGERAPRHYRIRGLEKNTSYDVLKVNVLVQIGEALHVDTFDLYSAKHRQAFANVAAGECGVEASVIQRDLGQVLLQLESLQDKAIQAALEPAEPSAYTLSDAERDSALSLLRDPLLTSRIVSDFQHTGLVGEPTNALMGYLAAVSRKLNTPLAIIVQSTSAAGKSALMDAVLNLVPDEDRVHYSAMTGQSLFYLGETNLKHKILGIAEEEGVRQAAYALKLLQSQGELTIASTGKDPQSGKLVTEEYRVEGPVMLFLTTTAIDIDEELLNRCVVLTINESREQTAAIQQRQREARTLAGLLANQQSDALIQQHRNAQRLLRPLAVVNPYAEQLRFADSRTRTRRDHEKYLTLIDSIALLHQYQRDVKTVDQVEYIEVALDDIALANQLAHAVLGRSLDELPPPTRQLLQQLQAWVADTARAEGIQHSAVRFTRRDVREAVGLSDKQVRVHLERLVELDYVLVHYGRNGQRFVYELVFDGALESDQCQMMGLIPVDALKDERLNGKAQLTENSSTTNHLVASTPDLVHRSWSASGEVGATLCTDEKTEKACKNKVNDASAASLDTHHTDPGQSTAAPYRSDTSLAAAGA